MKTIRSTDILDAKYTISTVVSTEAGVSMVTTYGTNNESGATIGGESSKQALEVSHEDYHLSAVLESIGVLKQGTPWESRVIAGATTVTIK